MSKVKTAQLSIYISSVINRLSYRFTSAIISSYFCCQSAAQDGKTKEEQETPSLLYALCHKIITLK
jgi:hypothetical protein